MRYLLELSMSSTSTSAEPERKTCFFDFVFIGSAEGMCYQREQWNGWWLKNVVLPVLSASDD